MTSDPGYRHLTDSNEAWRFGNSSYIIRLRGFLVTSILGGLPLAGVPFWWPDDKIGYIQVDRTLLVFWCGVASFLLFTFLFLYTRERTRRSLEIKAELHAMLHESLNSLMNLYRNSSSSEDDRRSSREIVKFHLESFSQHASNIIAKYFVSVTGDRHIGVIVRLLKNTDDGLGQEYVTVGRAGALNPSRTATSDGLQRNTGFPKFFLSEDVQCEGVLVITDKAKALIAGKYQKTRNDELFSSDFNSLAVVPIVGWDGSSKDLIGLLQITSRSKGITHPKHVDLLRFSGDVLGVHYTSAFMNLHRDLDPSEQVERSKNEHAAPIAKPTRAARKQNRTTSNRSKRRANNEGNGGE